MGSLLSQPMPDPAPTPAAASATALQPAAAPPSILSYFFPTPNPSLSHDHLEPTLQDIRLVMRYLSRLGLPSELVESILNMADYHASCRRHISKRIEVCSTCEVGHVKNEEQPFSPPQTGEVRYQALRVGGALRNAKGKVWYLCSSPLGCTGTDIVEGRRTTQQQRHPPGGQDVAEQSEQEKGRLERQDVWLRKVVIETFSKDQGWSSGNPAHYGTYEGSYSWFEISLLRGAREVEGSRHTVQHNVHAGQYFKRHRNVLQPDHPTLALAQPGDQIVLWVRARYPGWKNLINEAAITVFFSPYPPT
ncbi:hypothetical protein I317_00253 [Kwoniella heveanensis CBS 569]|nr:hypothetical protein I317_00253 [Kwoniella heveanensis CBS 569]